MVGDAAVVIGGSFAGLVAARVLADDFSHVTVVDRDELPDALVNRKGVPQTPHVHGVLRLGRDILDDLFPGFVEEAQAEGALLFDQLALQAMYNGRGWTARGRSWVQGLGVRRALLEQIVRRRVVALPNIEVARGAVDALVPSEDGERVVGVHLVRGRRARRSWSTDAGIVGGPARSPDGSILLADLVVDASGRGSAAPAWLEAIGYAPPEEVVVDGFVGYASRLYRVPEDAWPGDVRAIGQPPFPGQTRGGVLYPQDHGLTIMSLFGQSKDYPPSEPDEYLAYLATCATPLMYEVVARSEPVSDIVTSRSTANRLRRYEAMPRRPGGFVAVGDAVAAFNPVFGQGISAACLGNILLRDTLHELDGDVHELPGRFHLKLAEAVAYPWANAVGADLRFPATVGERGDLAPEVAEMGAYVGLLMELSTADLAVAEAVLLAAQTFDPGLLYGDELRAKVKAWVDEGRTPPFPDPTRVPSVADFVELQSDRGRDAARGRDPARSVVSAG